MKIRPQTFVAGLAGGATPMNKMGAKGFYVRNAGGMWWSKKPVIIANLPYTIESPTLGQIETRVEFGKIARQTRGMPLAQRLDTIANQMRGFRAPHRLSPEEYPSKKSGYHTLEQLEAMMARKLGGERGYYAAGEFYRGAGL